jgi:hypothetical protein
MRKRYRNLACPWAPPCMLKRDCRYQSRAIIQAEGKHYLLPVCSRHIVQFHLLQSVVAYFEPYGLNPSMRWSIEERKVMP